MTEIQLFEVCVVVGYASYSYCNEISQVQLYLKMLRLNHSEVSIIVLLSNMAIRNTDNWQTILKKAKAASTEVAF